MTQSIKESVEILESVLSEAKAKIKKTSHGRGKKPVRGVKEKTKPNRKVASEPNKEFAWSSADKKKEKPPAVVNGKEGAWRKIRGRSFFFPFDGSETTPRMIENSELNTATASLLESIGEFVSAKK